MKFLVTRTTGSRDKPCKNAIKEKYIYTFELSIDDPNKNPFHKESWYKTGINHRVENGHIKKDFEEEGWFLEINSLEELINLKEEVGEWLIIGETHNLLSIEIYNDYRE